MAGRPKEFKEEEVLNKAIDLFWTHGYRATSTDDLLRCMDLNKGSLYHTFGNKKELFSKSLDFFAEHSLKTIDAKIKNAKSPVEGITNFFLEVATNNDAHQKGCFMGNSVAELAYIDNELKEKAVANLIALEKLFHKHIIAAKKSKELKTNIDANVLAKYLINVWNGINITRRMYPKREILEPIIKLQLKFLM